MRDRERDRDRGTFQRSPPRPYDKRAYSRYGYVRPEVQAYFYDHSMRIKDLMRADLIALYEYNASLKEKGRKVVELYEKVESVLKRNIHLEAENERMSKLLYSRKNEVESLRERLYEHVGVRQSQLAEQEHERRRLLLELEQTQSELREIYHMKSTQVAESRAQHQVELQALKRQATSTQEVYYQEIRKLREALDRKEHETADASNRLKRLSSEAEYDVMRLKEEKEKLRNELHYVEADRKKYVESVRNKLEQGYLEEVEMLKRTHLSALYSFEAENGRLKELSEQRGIEAEQSSARAAKQRTTYEYAISMLRRDNENLRSKVLSNDQLGENERQQLKAKLNQLHESYIEEVRLNNQKYLDCLQGEMDRLENGMVKKNQYIELLVQEKAAMKANLYAEALRIREEVAVLQAKVKYNEQRASELATLHEARLKYKDRHLDYLEKLQADLTANANSEIASLKAIVEHEKISNEKAALQTREKYQQMLEEISELKEYNQNLKENSNREQGEITRKLYYMQFDLELIITEQKAKIDSLTSKNGVLEKEVLALKDAIELREKEMRQNVDRMRATEERLKKMERENEELRSRIIKKDQNMNEALSDQKKRLYATFTFSLDNLKSDNEAALKLAHSKNKDLEDKINLKEKYLEGLLRMYKKMRTDMEALTEQEANKKDMTLKFPGATADLIATKNLFDVYLKARVIDLCADAGKENHPE